ncbi:MAG: hypothetical protein GXY85_07135 [Candidatus Brocadiaceae bacterium]|nr:hypothetical protein [Candidatus Brocadiaceae bacterium]
MRWKGICAGLVLGLAASLAVHAVYVRADESESELLVRQFFRPLTWLLDQIESYYVEDVDRSLLLEGAYQGMIEQVDPGGLYLPAEMTERYGRSAGGSVPELGLTARFLPLGKVVAIDGTIQGRPAFQEGLLTGDFIVKIRETPDGEELEAEDFRTTYDAVRALRGEPGTRVVLTVVRPGRPEREVELTRALTPTPSVQAVQILDADPEIGYMALTHFDERTVGLISDGLAKLKDLGARSAVLDLRFNPGGPLDAALMCADLLLDEGVLLSARGRGDREVSQSAEPGDAFPDMKLALLVNVRTAEAAEMMAAALADNGRATLVGEPTLGRGSLRMDIRCPYDGSTIRLAVAHYVRPNGQEIERDREDPRSGGLTPDVAVELPPDDVRRLAAHLAGRAGPSRPPAPETAAEPQEPFVDVQLQRAVEHLRGALEPVPAEALAAVSAAG